MKKILMVSYLFAPENAIGAIRPTKLAKYLSKKNYPVTVVSTKHKLKIDLAFKRDLSELNQIIELGHSDYEKNKKTKTATNNSKKVLNKGNKIKFQELRFIKRQLLDFKKSMDFFQQFRCAIKNGKVKIKEYDYLFTTYGPVSSIMIGLWIKKKYPNIVWISDFRDPMVVEDTPFLFKLIYFWLQSKSCKRADYIVTISNGCLKKICGDKYKEKSYVITNGFDRDDALPNNLIKQAKKFTFAYTGSLYEGKRDMTILFKVLGELINENQINKIDIEINYAGNDFWVLEQQANKYNLESTLVNHGQLPREKSLLLQKESTFLILCTWNYKGEEGVLTGKFFEYMLMDKPIIALINGDKSDSETKSIINSANVGIAYEQANHISDYEQLKSYILLQYNRFIQGGNIEYNPIIEFIEKFNYLNITEELENICLK